VEKKRYTIRILTTVTSTGLPVAPSAVTRIVPVRVDVPVLALKLQLIVPELLPLSPDVIESQLPPDVTAAVQGMVPVPVLETLKVVVPASFATSRLVGLTDSCLKLLMVKLLSLMSSTDPLE
jgi:hypothetical protein